MAEFLSQMIVYSETTLLIYFHLVEGLLNFRRRVCRSFWLDLVSQEPPTKRTNIYTFVGPPNEIKRSSA